jgi:hypothetical protein
MANSIPISGLNNFSQIEMVDFIALVESSSMTTHRTPIQGLFDFMAITASCLSASYSITASNSHNAISASYAGSSSISVTASNANISSVALIASSSISSSYALTSSVCSMSFFAISSSTSTFVRQSDTASYLLYQGFVNGTASFSITSSWARESATASYALSIPSSGPVSIPGIVPIGTIIDFAGTTISDTNWMICDGSAINRTTYSTLFSVIGTTWGIGDGFSTFNLPDLRKRITIGAKGSLTDYQYDPANPTIGGSKISASVGNVGGGEAYQYHYHLMSENFNQINNDNVRINYIGYNKSLSTHHMYPSRVPSAGYTPPQDRAFPLWYLTGDSSGRTQPNSYDTTTTTNAYPMIVTSFGVSDTHNWFTCATFPNDWQGSKYLLSSGTSTANYDRNDLSMPYAVTNKIIRVL